MTKQQEWLTKSQIFNVSQRYKKKASSKPILLIAHLSFVSAFQNHSKLYSECGLNTAV